MKLTKTPEEIISEMFTARILYKIDDTVKNGIIRNIKACVASNIQNPNGLMTAWDTATLIVDYLGIERRGNRQALSKILQSAGFE